MANSSSYFVTSPNQSMKLSDFVIQFLYDQGIRYVFMISGHGNLHLIDSLGRHPKIKYLSAQHEQAAATAAEAYSKASGNLGAAIVTTGPGGTNAVSGVAAAWLDSVPVIYISGQVNTSESIRSTGVRQFGVQEINIVEVVAPITKYAVTVIDPKTIKYHLQKAVYLATSGRPGPVWLAIPLNVSHAAIDPKKLEEFIPDRQKINLTLLKKQVSEIIKLFSKAERPVILAGAGIKRAKAQNEFLKLAEKLGFPVLCTYSGADLIHHGHRLYVGRPGVNGTRAPNFAVQNSDLLLSVGSRLNTTQTAGSETYARAAKKIVVDIDAAELDKNWVKPDVRINFDAKLFLEELLKQIKNFRGKDLRPWVKKCQEWKKKYSPVLPEYYKLKKGVNSFVFIDALSDVLRGEDIFIHDMGSAFSCTMQAFKIKPNQYVSSNYGLANMGYFLPAAVGAWLGRGKKKRFLVTLCGDGGMQMTIGELQTIKHYKIPIKIFILNNHCYLTIKHSQSTYFQGRFVDSTPESGYSAPDFLKIARAYGLATRTITNQKGLKEEIRKVLNIKGPAVCDILMPNNQLLIPKLTAKVINGKFITAPLEDMYPFLPRKEFLKNMIIKPVEES